MSSHITPECLAQLRAGFQSDPVNRTRMHAVMKLGVNDASENLQEQIDNPLTFSVEIPTGAITNQKSSGRCWLFAALNTFRLEVMRRCNLESFELSQSWARFWDKLEKSNYFLESIL